jgi:hypothetical protein
MGGAGQGAGGTGSASGNPGKIIIAS